MGAGHYMTLEHDSPRDRRRGLAAPLGLLFLCVPAFGWPPTDAPRNARPSSNVVLATAYSGIDCGAKINAADAAWLGSPLEIDVGRSCGKTWAKPINLSTGHNLRFTLRGTYTLPGGNTLHGNNVVSGVQKDAVVLRLADQANANLIEVQRGAANITLKGFSVAGNASNQSGTSNGLYFAGENTNITIDDVAIDSTHDNAVYLQYADYPKALNNNITLRNSSLSNCGAACFELRDANNLWIQNNNFSNWGTIAANNDAIAAAGYNTNVQITGNTGVTSTSSYFFMESSSGSWQKVVNGADVSDNKITAVGSSSATGFSGYFFNTTFSKNVMLAPPSAKGACGDRSGFEIVGTGVKIIGNTLTNGAIALAANGPGQATSDVIISSNNLYSSCPFMGERGVIALGNSVTPITNVQISNNLIDLTGETSTSSISPIVVGFYGKAGSVSGFEIRNNTILAKSQNQSAGIYFLNSDPAVSVTNGKIHDNKISTGGERCAINIYDRHGQQISGVSIYNNDVSGSGSACSNEGPKE